MRTSRSLRVSLGSRPWLVCLLFVVVLSGCLNQAKVCPAVTLPDWPTLVPDSALSPPSGSTFDGLWAGNDEVAWAGIHGKEQEVWAYHDGAAEKLSIPMMEDQKLMAIASDDSLVALRIRSRSPGIDPSVQVYRTDGLHLDLIDTVRAPHLQSYGFVMPGQSTVIVDGRIFVGVGTPDYMGSVRSFTVEADGVVFSPTLPEPDDKANLGTVFRNLGRALAASNETLVIAGDMDGFPRTLPRGNVINELEDFTDGAVMAYALRNGTWRLAWIFLPDTIGDFAPVGFANSVATDGRIVVATSHFSIPQFQRSHVGGTGVVHILDAQSGIRLAGLLAPRDDEAFGASAAIWHGKVVVGAPRWDSLAPGECVPRDDAGSAYVLSNSTGEWVIESRLTGDSPFFGQSVVTLGDRLVISPAGHPGKAYVYTNATWPEP